MSSSLGRKSEQKPLVVDGEDGGDQEEAVDAEKFDDEEDDDFIEENEEELEKVLTEDIYSLLYTAPLCGLTYIFATVVFVLQAGLLLLIFADLVDSSSNPKETNNKTNRFDIPAGAEIEVTIAQFVGMLLTVMVMASDGDFMKGIMQLIEGYDPSILHDSPNATCIRWFITGFLQTMVGLLLLALSFILSMQSTTVIDLTLNLTGLHFIQELDDMGFKLASQGLISKQTQEDCKHVADLNRQPTPDAVKQKAKVTKRILIVLMAAALLIPYFFVVSWQFNGFYMCKTLYVQFGDAILPDMSYYSGLFQIQGNAFSDRKEGRPFYVDSTGSIQLAYCRAEEAWCFSYNGDNPCNYFMKSSDTENFDVIEVTLGGWLVRTDSGDVPVDWLVVACNDCNEDQCQGVCRDNKCECDNMERLGFQCEFEIPSCQSYRLDYRTKGSLASIPGSKLFLETEFTSLTGFDFIPKNDPLLTMYDRLWYIPNPGIENERGSYYIDSFMLFTGRRWVIYSIPTDATPPYTYVEFHQKVRSIVLDESFNNVDKLNAVMNEEFASYVPVFFSTPVDWGTESYGVEPSDIQWVLPRQNEDEDESVTTRVVNEYQADDDSLVGAKLLCSVCNSQNDKTPHRPCYNDGMCNDGKCLCTAFYDGSRCEFARSCSKDDDCYNGGVCDLTTNICICADNFPGNDDIEYSGLLCQYPNTIQDPYFCSLNENLCLAGACNGFEERCDCYEGYEGDRCDILSSP